MSRSSMSSADAIHVSMTVSFPASSLSAFFQQLVAHAVTQRLQNLDANGCGIPLSGSSNPSMAIPVLLQSAEDDFGCQRVNSPRLKQ